MPDRIQSTPVISDGRNAAPSAWPWILPELFENDASSARSEGSMEVLTLVWRKHRSKAGQYSSAKVHESLKRLLNLDGSFDAEALESALSELHPEIVAGF